MCVLFCNPPVSGQISRRLDRCLPYPSLADEISDMREEARAKISAQEGAPERSRTLVIDDVRFDGATLMPDSIRERLVTELKLRTFDADSEWLGEIENVSIRRAWQDQGFFKVEPTVRARVITIDTTVQHVLLTAHIDEGLQYKLADIRFRSWAPSSHLVFTSEELRKLIELQEGDILSATKIREGLEAIGELYRTHGYLDVVVTPLMDTDDQLRRVSFVMEVDQKKQFRLAKIQVFGPDPSIEELLKSKLKPGDIFNIQLIKNFLAENKLSLPPGVSFQDIDLHRDINRGTVDMRFNFQTCDQQRQ
jgi:outer membrane protein assembly factor BamA